MVFDYDLIVLGGGAAGMTSAKFAKGLGKRVAIVENDSLGGECTWTGCIPSKTLIKSALAAKTARALEKYGLRSKQLLELDVSQVLHHVRSVILEIYRQHKPETFKKAGIDVFLGDSTFIDEHHVAVGSKTISARYIVIATGSRPSIPPIEGIDNVSFFTNQNFFKIERLPNSIVIVGGGAVGIEMATALNHLGLKVTLIEINNHLLARDDQELVALLTKQLQIDGIELVTGARATRVAQKGRTITLTYQDRDVREHTVEAESMLVATGRRPNIEGLHLERAKVVVENDIIVVDATLKTTANNIYACGDVVGPYLFSHMAFHQAVIATRNAFIPFFKQKIDYKNVAWVTFGDPELATAGLTEDAARQRYGQKISVYRYSYAQLDRAHTDRELDGMGKFICDPQGRLVGAHILGARAGELISEVQLGKRYGIPFKNFYHVIHPYPTYAELVWNSAKHAYIESLQKSAIVQLARRLLNWKKG